MPSSFLRRAVMVLWTVSSLHPTATTCAAETTPIQDNNRNETLITQAASNTVNAQCSNKLSTVLQCVLSLCSPQGLCLNTTNAPLQSSTHLRETNVTTCSEFEQDFCQVVDTFEGCCSYCQWPIKLYYDCVVQSLEHPCPVACNNTKSEETILSQWNDYIDPNNGGDYHVFEPSESTISGATTNTTTTTNNNNNNGIADTNSRQNDTAGDKETSNNTMEQDSPPSPPNQEGLIPTAQSGTKTAEEEEAPGLSARHFSMTNSSSSRHVHDSSWMPLVVSTILLLRCFA